MSATDQHRISCAFCGAADFRHVYGRDHFLVKCRRCGLVCSGLIPSEELLFNYYHSYPSYDKVSALTLRRYQEILDKLEPYRKSNNLLEAGCGFGFFLEEARKRDWNVFGTELSETALMECRRKGLNVSESPGHLMPDYHEKFDAIVSIEVIEHLSEPIREITVYKELLSPGGALYITTPNYNSLSRRLLNTRWNVILYPEHIYYFTLTSIKKILISHGFEKVKEETSGFSHARLIYAFRSKRGDKDLSEYDYNEKDRELRDAIEKTIILRLIKKTINTMLTIFKAGDTLKILYRKK